MNVINPMTAEQKDKWVAALRSGEYDQGTGVLSKEGEVSTSYCCLGVANAVLGLGVSPSACYLRDYKNRNWASQFLFLDDNTQRTLAEMNDGGKSFINIADHIEANIHPSV